MDYIEWNYIQAKKQADRLEEQAGRLSKLASEQMENTLRELAYNWKGSSASADPVFGREDISGRDESQGAGKKQIVQLIRAGTDITD